MMKGILGKKIGMTQVFAKNGELVPVTVIKVEDNKVLQVKTIETDGYNAIQLGVQDKKEKNTSKPELGHAKKAGTIGKRFKKEIRLDESTIANYEMGQTLSVDMFEAGEFIDVQGTTKGKGFQGVIKRHGQSRGPMSHGSRYHRRPGSMGAVAPAVFKGKNLPGHMGHETVTVQNLEIVMVNLEENVILVKGNVPGGKNSFIVVKSAIKKPNFKKETFDLVGYDGSEGIRKEEPVKEEPVEEVVATEETKEDVANVATEEK